MASFLCKNATSTYVLGKGSHGNCQCFVGNNDQADITLHSQQLGWLHHSSILPDKAYKSFCHARFEMCHFHI